LEGALTGYYRLRVASYRVIYSENYVAAQRVIECVFAERRSVVYDLFNQMICDGLT
jgi:mRNA-degrading endonuclease RelE of RelBE toxin-antitoxin system